MAVLLVLVCATLIAPIVSAFLPRRWGWLGLAMWALSAGLLWLDMHVQPMAEGGDDFGIGVFLKLSWLVLGTLASVALIGREAAASGRPRRSGEVAPLGLWPVPIGILLGVFFMHWLSNRLAGATPPETAHLVTGAAGIAVGAGAGWLAWQVRSRWSFLRDVGHLAAAGGLTAVVWVVVCAMDADRAAALARETADGAPWCAMTFAGHDHPRPARRVLDLSRLVSRSGGRSFIDDAHWLIVARDEGIVALRLRSGLSGPVKFDLLKIDSDAAPCIPEPGGNLHPDRKRSLHPPLTVERG